MTKLTIEVDEEVAKRLADAAADRGIAPETVAAEAVAEKFPPRRRLGFVGSGHSGRGDAARNLKELRREAAAEKLKRMADERRPAEG